MAEERGYDEADLSKAALEQVTERQGGNIHDPQAGTPRSASPYALRRATRELGGCFL
jgi:hypothetical protein